MASKRNKKFTFIWKIKHFLSCCHKSNESLRSPIFIAKSLDDTRWFMEIYPKGKIIRSTHIWCFLHRGQDSEVDEIEVEFKLKIKNNNGESLEKRRFPKQMFKKSQFWGTNDFIKIDLLEEKLMRLNDDTLIVSCTIFINEPIPASLCIAWTKINMEQRSFKWNVKNVSSFSWTESQKFAYSESLQIKIILTAPDEDVNITIQKIGGENLNSLSLTIKLSLLEVKGVECSSRRSRYLFLPKEKNDTKQFPSFFTRTMLCTGECKYLENGMFTLRVEFSVSNGTTLDGIAGYYNDESDYAQPHAKQDSIAVLQEDFKRMFTGHIKTDVSLRAENQTFEAHKSILSARSSIFATMFSQNMLENQTGVVNINDVDGKALENFLLFIYTGTVQDMDYENAMKLIIIADKYQVSTLKDECSIYLTSALNAANACDVLVIADMIGHEDLKTSAIDYIIAQADNIFISNVWSNFIQDNVKLATDIFHKLSSNFVNHKKLVSK